MLTYSVYLVLSLKSGATPPLMVQPMSCLVDTGVISPQLVLECLVSFEQHRLELVRAVQLAADH